MTQLNKNISRVLCWGQSNCAIAGPLENKLNPNQQQRRPTTCWAVLTIIQLAGWGKLLFPFYSSLERTNLKYCKQFWAPEYKKNTDVHEKCCRKPRCCGSGAGGVQREVVTIRFTEFQDEKSKGRHYHCLQLPNERLTRRQSQTLMEFLWTLRGWKKTVTVKCEKIQLGIRKLLFHHEVSPSMKQVAQTVCGMDIR